MSKKRIKMNGGGRRFQAVYQDFITSQTAKGVSDITKNGKIQVIPLCSRMVNVLRGYMTIRGGEAADYLFCDEYGGMLSENALRLAIAKYNQRRGVRKTGLHLFRHTFARKYLVDCGGDAFTLQKLLGHSTLAMTKR